MKDEDLLVKKITQAVKKHLKNSSSEDRGRELPSSQKVWTPEEVAKSIDHTLLKADASEIELRKLCDEAKKHHFFSVCVNSSNVSFVANQLSGSDVKTCAVVGFPLGAGTSNAKAYETKEACLAGADEIDMVLNIGALKSTNFKVVLADIVEVVSAADGKTVKVILETGMLNKEEIIIASVLSKAAGAAFVKTSTGFGPKGATVEDVSLMRKTVGNDLGVKASGGIRSWDDAISMLNAGATRLGCSSGVSIVTREASTKKGY
jgi:deoxyribose-phosphate aldolase